MVTTHLSGIKSKTLSLMVWFTINSQEEIKQMFCFSVIFCNSPNFTQWHKIYYTCINNMYIQRIHMWRWYCSTCIKIFCGLAITAKAWEFRWSWVLITEKAQMHCRTGDKSFHNALHFYTNLHKSSSKHLPVINYQESEVKLWPHKLSGSFGISFKWARISCLVSS